MKRPQWAASPTARRWLVVGAIVVLLLAGWLATESFGTQATLSDGARAYATCKAPWRAARIAPPAERFTLLVITGGTGKLREEGVATLGARCRLRARGRMAFATTMLAGVGLFAWLAVARPTRPESGPSPPPPDAVTG